MRLHVEKSKTDQTKKGMTKPLYRAEHTTLCPVMAYTVWLDRNEVRKKGSDTLFLTQNNQRRPISKTTFSENSQTALTSSGLARIMGHSHHAGAATDVVLNHASIDQVCLLGGWRDPWSVKAYVKRSELGREEVARTLRL